MCTQFCFITLKGIGRTWRRWGDNIKVDLSERVYASVDRIRTAQADCWRADANTWVPKLQGIS